nr:MAG TPA: hypothetical protein [Caudoviricetes sp.]
MLTLTESTREYVSTNNRRKVKVVALTVVSLYN